MRILFINQFFPPDLAPTGQLLSDVTSYLSEQGHDVSVLCSDSVYAEGGRPAQGSEKVYRLKGLRFRRSLVGRSACYLAFLFDALRLALTIKDIDAIVTLTTPPLLSFVGAIAKRFRGCQFFIWEMDLFPESLVTMGLLGRRSVLVKILRKVADLPRRQADGIIVLGSCMRSQLIAHGLPSSGIKVAENWSKTTAGFSPLPNNPWLTVFYSGNLGASHDTETIFTAMTLLGSDPRFQFVFAGGGAKRKNFERRCRELNLTQVQFVPYGESAEYAARLRDADIGLVTQTDLSLGAVVPSKLYSILAFGRPVLFAGPESSTVARVIKTNNCGWHVPCGAGPQLADLLKYLAGNHNAIATAARNARSTYLSQYTVASGTGRIAEALGLGALVETHSAKSAHAGS